MMQLDDYQSKAAKTCETDALVSAVPGSGKTRTLAARVLHLVNELEFDPSTIVLLTFTRYAAREMRSRLGPMGRHIGFIGTFHAFALNIIQEFGGIRAWEGEWLTLLDESEAQLDEEEVLTEQGIIGRQGNWKRCDRQTWEVFKEGLINGNRTPDPENDDMDKRLMTVWKGCMDRMRAQNVLTFGALILEAIGLMEGPEVSAVMHKRFRHYLTDESQDSDYTQWKLIRLLKPESLFVVGDPCQAIYRWRGAAPELFSQYGEKDAEVYPLPNSYRFGFNIAEPANNLIKHSESTIGVAINAIASNAGTVKVFKRTGFQDIAGMVQNEISLGAKPDDIAILARRHRTLDRVAECLKEAKVPCTRIGGQDDTPKSAEFRVVKGYMRLAVNPKDKRAFMAVTVAERLPVAKILELRERSLKDGISLVEAFAPDSETFPPKTIEDLEAYLRHRDPANDYDRALDYVKEVARYEGLVSMGDLVRYLTMENVQDKLRAADGTVVAGTVHFSKGLQWPIVFVVGLNSKQFPSPRSVKAGGIDEEINLAYVACTRAEEKLYLIHHENESDDDGESIFLDWINEDEGKKDV